MTDKPKPEPKPDPKTTTDDPPPAKSDEHIELRFIRQIPAK